MWAKLKVVIMSLLMGAVVSFETKEAVEESKEAVEESKEGEVEKEEEEALAAVQTVEEEVLKWNQTRSEQIRRAGFDLRDVYSFFLSLVVRLSFPSFVLQNSFLFLVPRFSKAPRTHEFYQVESEVQQLLR